MGRVSRQVTAEDLNLGEPPRTARKLRSNLVDPEHEDPPAPAVLTEHDAPVQKVRRVRAQKAASPIPTTVVSNKYVKIQIEENEHIPVSGMFISLNGRGYLVKPGVPVDVPPGVLEILSNAVEKMPVVDPQTRQVVGYRDRMRYPYRVVT